MRIGFCRTKSDILQYWRFACFLLHAQMFKLTKHSFLNSIRIWSGSELWQRFFFFFFKGERIQISQKAGHHRPASETPLNGVSLACWWWPNVECWLGSFENFRGSGPVLLRNSMFLWFFRWGGRGVPDPLSPLWIRAWDRTKSTLIEIYWKPILSCASAFVLDRQVERERERCVFFWILSLFLNQRARLRISKIRAYLCKKFWSTRCPWVTVLHYKRHLRRWRASKKCFGFHR